ncbi:hypothetical protein HDU88_001432 [Geranomyces variabilis]|nr:hypothetical protein HDU88_001432 [Geranomyces variabilis]
MATGVPLSTNTPFIFVVGNMCWCNGRCVIWVWLMSVLASTPRTSVKIKLPNDHRLALILRGVLLFETLSTTPFAGWAAARLEKGDFATYSNLVRYIYLMHSVESLALATGIWLFGGQVIQIAEEGRKALKATGNTLDVKLTRSILKLKVTRFAAVNSLTWNVAVLTVFAFRHEQVFQLLWWSICQCFIGFVGVTSLFATSQIVMIWAEFNPKRASPDTFDILRTMQTEQGTQVAVTRITGMKTQGLETLSEEPAVSSVGA